MEYCSYSGNITIQLSDHLFQFVLFLETAQNLNIEEILCLSDKDPNVMQLFIA